MTTTLSSRLRVQLLTGPPASSPEEVVGHLLAVQSQDIRGARLAVRARSCGLASRHVDEAMTTARSLVVTWLNRGTLHLVRAADYWWLAALTSPLLVAGNTRRLMQEGLEPSEAGRGVAVILQAIADRGPLTRG